MNDFRAQIADRFGAFPRLALEAAHLRPAAVAILLCPLEWRARHTCLRAAP